MHAPELPTEPGGLAAFGSRLRSARLAKNLNVEDLAAKLCMRPEQIAALEAGDRQQWPEDAFAIAQVRRLATSLGLEADLLVSELRILLQQVPDAMPSAAAIAVMGASSKRTDNTPNREEGTKNWINPSTKSKSKISVLPFAWLAGFAVLIGLGSIGVKQLSFNQLSSKKQAIKIQVSAPKIAAPAPTNKNLRLIANQTAWLAVRELDGKKLIFEGKFKGTRVFALGKGLELRSGRPDLVQVQFGAAAAKPLGRIEVIEWVKFMPPR
ncbi:helix-turn-helix domain-containing protein [Synechococcus sp. UW140]|uniref:helix-turn-helix domain-containing protein n=1 Tax=Synechococcus sp. UW140 TaxID=368503 RepID=UPI0025DAA43F|nr:helix-turn-helix domain-containing protein [Synechococcus sp. UW140]